MSASQVARGTAWAIGLVAAAGLGLRAEPPVEAPPDPARVPALETYRDWPGEHAAEAHWLPWDRPAFQRASLFARPVFFELTVNWSRAAQRLDGEVLTEPPVLREVNRAYVSVRVNADARPDLRERYQTGVWPMVALLLPNGLPMLSRAQERDLKTARPITAAALEPDQLEFFLREGWIYWSRWDDLLFGMGAQWARANAQTAPTRTALEPARSELVERWMLANADRQGGGFGLVPKFFAPWVLEYAEALDARGRGDLASHARTSLERLVQSPLFDGVDGGLHRVAAAPNFEEISYEKLLEPNAGFLRELEVALAREDSQELRQALEHTTSFLLEGLQAEAAGFHLAQAADPTSPDGGGYWHAKGEGAPPPLDPLVLSGPNVMAGAALVRAGLRLENDEAVQAGRRAIDRVLAEAYRPGRGLLHSVSPPAVETDLWLVTQASGAFGLYDAYEATGERRYLEAARDLARAALSNFRTGGEHALRDRIPLPTDVGLLLEPRWPMRANVRLARALLRLSWHDDSEELGQEASRLIESYLANPGQYEVHGAELGLAVEEALAQPLLVKLPGAGDVRWARAVAQIPRAWKVVSWSGAGSGETGARVELGDRSMAVESPDRLAAAVQELIGSGTDAASEAGGGR